jgi:APA family basic amino acid/polyamine antiporter
VNSPKLLRQLGARDAALIVMGGIIGTGIFMTPSVVAQRVHGVALIMAAWIAGGIVVMLGAFVFAELAARRPHDGGFYAYLRDAFHPVLAFSYGWTLLLVSQSGGAAAAAVTFAAYFVPLTGIHIDVRLLAALAVAFFTLVNALGVRAGTTTQNWLMMLKIAAIAGLVLLGLLAPHGGGAAAPAGIPAGGSLAALAALGFALVPVMFSYDGYQTANFMTAELKQPERTLPRGLIYGVLLVLVLYLAVNAVDLLVLGPAKLAATATPASAVAQAALGPIGARIMAAIITLSALGFLSNQILTSPRIYFQMAADGLFFKALGRIDPRTHVPTIAIALQGAVTLAIALFNGYGQIVNAVSGVDFVFFGLGALALFVFRKRDRGTQLERVNPMVPGHPWTTLVYLVVFVALILDEIVSAPYDAAWALGVLLSSVPVYTYFAFRSRRRLTPAEPSISQSLRG